MKPDYYKFSIYPGRKQHDTEHKMKGKKLNWLCSGHILTIYTQTSLLRASFGTSFLSPLKKRYREISWANCLSYRLYIPWLLISLLSVLGKLDHVVKHTFVWAGRNDHGQCQPSVIIRGDSNSIHRQCIKGITKVVDRRFSLIKLFLVWSPYWFICYNTTSDGSPGTSGAVLIKSFSEAVN